MVARSKDFDALRSIYGQECIPSSYLELAPASFCTQVPEEGERVRVTEVVQVLKSETLRDVRVQATQIQILESP